jgi:hypothetical protein
MNYLNALRDYDRAQVQLAIVLGAATDHPGPPGSCRPPAPLPQLPKAQENGQ